MPTDTIEAQEKTKKFGIREIGIGMSVYLSMLFKAFDKISKIEARMNDSETLKKYHKRTLALYILRSMTERCKKNYSDYLVTEVPSLKQISQYYPALSKRIISTRVKLKEDLLLLMWASRILQTIKANRGYGVSYVATHLKDILQKVDMIKDKKVARILRAYFIIISGLETEYLVKYIAEVRTWRQKVTTMPLESYFIRVVRGFLNGDVQLGYLGLLSYFRDGVIYKELAQKNYAKQLLNYLQERKYIEVIRNDIQKGLSEGKWEDFYKFWKHIEGVIRTLERDYGNIQFGEKIRTRKSEFGESPVQWLALFNQTVNEMYNTYYIKGKLIEPAAAEIDEVFSRRQQQLAVEKERLLQPEQIDRIVNLISRDSKIITLRALRAVLSEEEKITNKILKEQRTKINGILNGHQKTMIDLEPDVAAIVDFLTYYGKTMEQIEVSNKPVNDKAAKLLAGYTFASNNIRDIMRRSPAFGTLANRLFSNDMRGIEIAQTIEEANQRFIIYCLEILRKVYQFGNSVNTSFEEIKMEILPEFTGEFWNEFLSKEIRSEG